MPLRRVALCFTAFVLFFAVSSGTRTAIAQLVVTRTHDLASTQEQATERLYPHRSVRPMAQTHAFTLTPSTPDSFDVSHGEGPYDYIATLQNTAKQPLQMQFKRLQSLPCGWQSSICFGSFCYSSEKDSDVYTVTEDSILLIIHVYSNVGAAPVAPVVYLTLAALDGNPDDTMQIAVRTNYTPSAEPHFFEWQNAVFRRSFVGPKKHVLTANLANRSCSPAKFHFTVQPSLPASWTWKYCVNDPVAISDSCTTASTFDYDFSPINDGSSEDVHKISFTVVVPDSFKTADSAVFLVNVRQQIGTTLDSSDYRFSLIVAPAASVVNEGASMRAGIVVLNAWPNPITTNSNLNLELMTDKHGPGEAHIYDMAGVEKASFDLGDLAMGSNHLTVSGFRLPSGEYILRLEQDGAMSGPVRLNIIH